MTQRNTEYAMLANKNTVAAIVKTLANMQGTVIERRYWSDKAKDATKRNLAFKFYDKAEADVVANKLQAALQAQGFTNTVKRTTSEANVYVYKSGAEYVRVQTLA
jgi:hypothetical protein